ncbi:PadR family transcriptional regulator [Kutzneria sp. NPDC052558]|uniref:PadR family transcriptional regulator n=1 Tax=Kutzneria sp. NPDC052558 TaxID=3364121 RepID=UPI0037C4F5EF
MNSTRLFALSALARGGAMHGYAIRQAAQLDRTELWTDVKPGSLYSVLKRMADEGLVRVARTERDGNPPERTVFEITEAGRAELVRQRDAALLDVRLRPDPVDLALQFTPDLSPDRLTTLFTVRRQAVAEQLAQFRREQVTAAPDLTGLEPLIFEHCVARLEAELAWHDRVLDRLRETT